MTDTEGIAHYIPQMTDGWSPVEKCQMLCALVKETAAKHSVEIGVWDGRGTVSMAFGHRTQGFGVVHAIDPWKAEASEQSMLDEANRQFWNDQAKHDRVFGQFLGTVDAHHVWPWVTVHKKKSNEALIEFEDESVSVLHQDGNHSEEVSSAEVTMYAPKMKPGGYWVMDDCLWTENGKRTTLKAQMMMVEMGWECTFTSADGNWRIFRKPGAKSVNVTPIANTPTPEGPTELERHTGVETQAEVIVRAVTSPVLVEVEGRQSITLNPTTGEIATSTPALKVTPIPCAMNEPPEVVGDTTPAEITPEDKP